MNLEDPIDGIEVIFYNGTRPYVLCRITLFGDAEDIIEGCRRRIDARPWVQSLRADPRVDEGELPCRTFLFRADRINPDFTKDLRMCTSGGLIPLVLLSWGYPLHRKFVGISDNGEIMADEIYPYRGGRVIFSRWDEYTHGPKCPLTRGDGESENDYLYRVHLWGMEFHRTHHQWKQGIIDATNVQMV